MNDSLFVNNEVLLVFCVCVCVHMSTSVSLYMDLLFHRPQCYTVCVLVSLHMYVCVTAEWVVVVVVGIWFV